MVINPKTVFRRKTKALRSLSLTKISAGDRNLSQLRPSLCKFWGFFELSLGWFHFLSLRAPLRQSNIMNCSFYASSFQIGTALHFNRPSDIWKYEYDFSCSVKQYQKHVILKFLFNKLIILNMSKSDLKIFLKCVGS